MFIIDNDLEDCSLAHHLGQKFATLPNPHTGWMTFGVPLFLGWFFDPKHIQININLVLKSDEAHCACFRF